MPLLLYRELCRCVGIVLGRLGCVRAVEGGYSMLRSIPEVVYIRLRTEAPSLRRELYIEPEFSLVDETGGERYGEYYITSKI